MSPHAPRSAASALSGGLLLALLAMCGNAHAKVEFMMDSADMGPGTDELARCHRYDKLQSQGTSSPPLSTCDTVSPNWGTLRDKMADNGWLIQGGVGAGVSYDLFHHDEHPQMYIGQNPSFRTNPYITVTYDLSRIGFAGDSLLLFNADYQAFSFAGENPTGLSLNSLYVSQRFNNGAVQVQYGFEELSNQFYGFSLGTSATASTAGISSSIPFEVGLLNNKTAPEMNVRVAFGPGNRYYERFGVTRSVSPDGVMADWQSNNYLGLKWHIPGAKALYLNELGYLSDAAPGQRMAWLRGGVIYNESHYPDFRNGGYAGSNYAYYLVSDYQLTQASAAQPFRGLYLNAKVDYAPPDRNVYSSDIGITPYVLGPFGRPDDVMSFSYTFNRLSKSFQCMEQSRGLSAVDFSTTYAVAYVYRVKRGIYLTDQLSYTVNPIATPRRPAALTWMSSLSLYY
jgi:porin